MKKACLVVHSGGMDSSICLALAIEKYGKDQVLSLGFRYGQRHSTELDAASKICADWGVDQVILDLGCVNQITENSLTRHGIDIAIDAQGRPNTLVVGRNGLMAFLASMHAYTLGAKIVMLGVIGIEAANSGYRDCSRAYMDIVQSLVRIDLAHDDFVIATPVVDMTKCETLEVADRLGVLEYLNANTVTCYRGLKHPGCQSCPACLLRNEGLAEFRRKHPHRTAQQ